MLDFRSDGSPERPHVYLRLDRRSMTLTPADYAPPPAGDRDVAAGDRRAARAADDDETVLELVREHPLSTGRALARELAPTIGLARDRASDALGRLARAGRVAELPGARRAVHYVAAR